MQNENKDIIPTSWYHLNSRIPRIQNQNFGGTREYYTWLDLEISVCLTVITLWGTSIASKILSDNSSNSFDICVLELRMVFMCLHEFKIIVNSTRKKFYGEFECIPDIVRLTYTFIVIINWSAIIEHSQWKFAVLAQKWFQIGFFRYYIAHFQNNNLMKIV